MPKRGKRPPRGKDVASEGLPGPSSRPWADVMPRPRPPTADPRVAGGGGRMDLESAFVRRGQPPQPACNFPATAVAPPTQFSPCGINDMMQLKRQHGAIFVPRQLRKSTWKQGDPPPYLPPGHPNGGINPVATNAAASGSDQEYFLVAAALTGMRNSKVPNLINRKQSLTVNDGHFPGVDNNLIGRLQEEQIASQSQEKLNMNIGGADIRQVKVHENPTPAKLGTNPANPSCRHHYFPTLLPVHRNQAQTNGTPHTYRNQFLNLAERKIGHAPLPTMPTQQSFGADSANLQQTTLNSTIDITEGSSDPADRPHNVHAGLSSASALRPVLPGGRTNVPANSNATPTLNDQINGGMVQGSDLPTASALADGIFDDDGLAALDGGVRPTERYSECGSGNSPPVMKSQNECTANPGSLERVNKGNSDAGPANVPAATSKDGKADHSDKITPRFRLESAENWDVKKKSTRGVKRHPKNEKTKKAVEGKPKRAKVKKEVGRKQSATLNEGWRPLPEVHVLIPREDSNQKANRPEVTRASPAVAFDPATRSVSGGKPSNESQEVWPAVHVARPLPPPYPPPPAKEASIATVDAVRPSGFEGDGPAGDPDKDWLPRFEPVVAVDATKPTESKEERPADESDKDWLPRELHTPTPPPPSDQHDLWENKSVVAKNGPVVTADGECRRLGDPATASRPLTEQHVSAENKSLVSKEIPNVKAEEERRPPQELYPIIPSATYPQASAELQSMAAKLSVVAADEAKQSESAQANQPIIKNMPLVTMDGGKQSVPSEKLPVDSDEERRPKGAHYSTPLSAPKEEVSVQTIRSNHLNDSTPTVDPTKRMESMQERSATSDEEKRLHQEYTPPSQLTSPQVLSVQMNCSVVVNVQRSAESQKESPLTEVKSPTSKSTSSRKVSNQTNKLLVANESVVTLDASGQHSFTSSASPPNHVRPKCRVEGCANFSRIRGFCHKHRRANLASANRLCRRYSDRLTNAQFKSIEKQSEESKEYKEHFQAASDTSNIPMASKPVSMKKQVSVTLTCPTCMKEFTYNHPGTAHATFSKHTSKCGRPENGITIEPSQDTQKSQRKRPRGRPRKKQSDKNGKCKVDEKAKSQSPIAHMNPRKRRKNSDLAATETPPETNIATSSKNWTRDGTMPMGARGQKSCKGETSSQIIHAQSSYPYAPMGHLWLETTFNSIKCHVGRATLNAGGTLIGRRWVWDEGYFVDSHFDPQSIRRGREVEASLLKVRCTCGANHSSTRVKTDKNIKPNNNDWKSNGRARRSDRSASSYSSIVAAQIANGRLDPHTLISCEEYEMGPEFRFMKNVQSENVQPFFIRVNPDATFLADLHAHLCNSEIIGLLGGHYSKEEKCIYIQAAFPCKSTDRTDSGQTDVEMDPIGQIYATEAIANHGMSVVGWYHSHPDFQPNPSITDIDNQASYQQLFQGDNLTSRNSGNIDLVSPFVGLIVGTYDGNNPSANSVMRWFHCRQKSTEHKSVNFPMNLKTTDRHFRKLTFENKSTEDNVRRSLTLRGNDIRGVLESRYLCCPVTESQISQMNNATKLDAGRQSKHAVNVCEQNGGLGRDAQSVVFPSGKAKSGQIDSTTSSISHKQAHPNENETATNEKSSLLIIETGKSPLLLSESSVFGQKLEKKQNQGWNFQSARPLYFTRNERTIFEMKQDSVPDDVFAGIIWFAVEREQQMVPKYNANKTSTKSPVDPASSRSILELLLRQTLTFPNSLLRKLYCIIHCLDDTGSLSPIDRFVENDAAIIHNVDVVLGHYAPKQNRINPFSSWPGAGDKGNISKEGNGSTSDSLFFEFYLTKILKMKPMETEDGQVYRGGNRMKRGHKIAASLLKWARNMQLGPTNSDKKAYFSVGDSQDMGLRFDHEQNLGGGCNSDGANPPQQCQYIYFVSEVMRLLAARWRECGARKTTTRQSTPRRRGRPPKRVPS